MWKKVVRFTAEVVRVTMFAIGVTTIFFTVYSLSELIEKKEATKKLHNHL